MSDNAVALHYYYDTQPSAGAAHAPITASPLRILTGADFDGDDPSLDDFDAGADHQQQHEHGGDDYAHFSAGYAYQNDHYTNGAADNAVPPHIFPAGSGNSGSGSSSYSASSSLTLGKHHDDNGDGGADDGFSDDDFNGDDGYGMLSHRHRRPHDDNYDHGNADDESPPAHWFAPGDHLAPPPPIADMPLRSQRSPDAGLASVHEFGASLDELLGAGPDPVRISDFESPSRGPSPLTAADEAAAAAAAAANGGDDLHWTQFHNGGGHGGGGGDWHPAMQYQEGHSDHGHSPWDLPQATGQVVPANQNLPPEQEISIDLSSSELGEGDGEEKEEVDGDGRMLDQPPYQDHGELAYHPPQSYSQPPPVASAAATASATTAAPPLAHFLRSSFSAHHQHHHSVARPTEPNTVMDGDMPHQASPLFHRSLRSRPLHHHQPNDDHGHGHAHAHDDDEQGYYFAPDHQMGQHPPSHDQHLVHGGDQTMSVGDIELEDDSRHFPGRGRGGGYRRDVVRDGEDAAAAAAAADLELLAILAPDQDADQTADSEQRDDERSMSDAGAAVPMSAFETANPPTWVQKEDADHRQIVGQQQHRPPLSAEAPLPPTRLPQPSSVPSSRQKYQPHSPETSPYLARSTALRTSHLGAPPPSLPTTSMRASQLPQRATFGATGTTTGMTAASSGDGGATVSLAHHVQVTEALTTDLKAILADHAAQLVSVHRAHAATHDQLASRVRELESELVRVRAQAVSVAELRRTIESEARLEMEEASEHMRADFDRRMADERARLRREMASGVDRVHMAVQAAVQVSNVADAETQTVATELVMEPPLALPPPPPLAPAQSAAAIAAISRQWRQSISGLLRDPPPMPTATSSDGAAPEAQGAGSALSNDPTPWIALLRGEIESDRESLARLRAEVRELRAAGGVSAELMRSREAAASANVRLAEVNVERERLQAQVAALQVRQEALVVQVQDKDAVLAASRVAAAASQEAVATLREQVAELTAECGRHEQEINRRAAQLQEQCRGAYADAVAQLREPMRAALAAQAESQKRAIQLEAELKVVQKRARDALQAVRTRYSETLRKIRDDVEAGRARSQEKMDAEWRRRKVKMEQHFRDRLQSMGVALGESGDVATADATSVAG
ncbi:hypothetical protein BC828DRAFT_374726 [Blastocladiella britannica]|nr:hypothetical protein BC828DRAFT_374726 [Blastocladiella britannica]